MASFLGRRSRDGWCASVLRSERADVREQLQQLLLAQLALKGRHLGLIAGDDLRRRIEDRFTDVALVGFDGAAALERHRRAENPDERRPPASAVREMTRVAGSLVEEPLPELRQRLAG